MRAFVGMDLTAECRSDLERVQHRYAPLESGSLRWLPGDSFHVTLRFIEELPLSRVATFAAELERLRAALPREDVARRIIAFPAPTAAQVIVTEVEDAAGQLGRAAARLEELALASGLAPSQHAFRPHITLARAPREGVDASVLLAVPLSDPVALRFSAVVLYESARDVGGARYTALSRFALG